MHVRNVGGTSGAESPPSTGPQAKACGSVGANESSQSRGLQPTGLPTVGAILGIELFGT